MATKLQTIQNDYKLMRKLHPNMDKRKIKNNVYFRFSSKWRCFIEKNKNSLISTL